MSEERAARSIEILLVEDNPGDVRLTIEALHDGKIANRLHVVSDGVEAIAFVRQEGPYADTVRPDLILLDLNLPKKNGQEVLLELKADPQSERIPVVILTTSREEHDVLRAYALDVAGYITKPVDFEQFVDVVRAIAPFHFSVVTLVAA